MKKILLLLTAILPLTAVAQRFEIDMTKPLRASSDAVNNGVKISGYGAKKNAQSSFYVSVDVPDGNYHVTVQLGSDKQRAITTVRGENRRLFAENIVTAKKQYINYSFVINKRSPRISNTLNVKIKDRERNYFTWDDQLTLEFNGAAPAVRHITIERDSTAPTVYLCGNSTVVDQYYEPWASWGQMITRWFDDKVVISNHAESGLTAGSFLASNRLEKILTTLHRGDYVFCEFGHNDQKEHRPGDGAWYNYAHNLKIFIDKVRQKGATIIFCTPTQRRSFDASRKHIVETHGDYPTVMTTVAQREQVPVIDLHAMTRTFFETLGYANSTKALVHYPANTFPGQAKELADNTHFNPYGAYEVAKMVVMGIKKLQLPLAAHLRADWRDYNPAQPDDYNRFVWVPAPVYESLKPDGN